MNYGLILDCCPNDNDEWELGGIHIEHFNDPFIKNSRGDIFWHVNRKIHRENGPAAEYADGNKEWYYHGKKVECSSQEEFEKIIKLKGFW